MDLNYSYLELLLLYFWYNLFFKYKIGLINKSLTSRPLIYAYSWAPLCIVCVICSLEILRSCLSLRESQRFLSRCRLARCRSTFLLSITILPFLQDMFSRPIIGSSRRKQERIAPYLVLSDHITSKCINSSNYY
jgi:hypothetical protein